MQKDNEQTQSSNKWTYYDFDAVSLFTSSIRIIITTIIIIIVSNIISSNICIIIMI